jgi:hypothetical protein
VEIAVLACLQTSLPVPDHGMRCQGDDLLMEPGPLLQTSDRPGGVKAVHFRHLYVHQNEIVGLIVTIFPLPETKGKSLEELSDEPAAPVEKAAA